MKILIKNGRVIDPATGTDAVMDVEIADGVIAQVAESIKDKADREIDAKGCFVMPGFIDLHVHFRDPGLEYKEDIETGARAAAHGGYTTVFAMPNTKPVVDNPDVVNYVHNKAKHVGLTNVCQVGAVTKGMLGETLADIHGMAQAGIKAVSEDGKSVMNSQIYREGMQAAVKEDLVVFAHCEDIKLVHGGVMNAGKKAEELGLPGITNSVEDVITARDILLAKETGVRLHLCHCSTADSIRMVKLAKEDGLPVSGEVCPHHFTLCEEDITSDDGMFKMNPPLRSKADMEALREALRDDIMDVISTDHAPHSREEKERSIRTAAFGIVGLETAAALTYSELVLKEYLTPMQMAEKMSYNPARIAKLEKKGSLKEGMDADVVIFDPRETYRIDVKEFRSKGKNTPFDGREVTGKVAATILGGRIVYEERQTK